MEYLIYKDNNEQYSSTHLSSLFTNYRA